MLQNIVADDYVELLPEVFEVEDILSNKVAFSLLLDKESSGLLYPARSNIYARYF